MLQVTETIQNLRMPPNQPDDNLWVPNGARGGDPAGIAVQTQNSEIIASYPGVLQQDTEAKLAPNFPD